MKRYKLYDIEWDVEDDNCDYDALPKFVFMDSDEKIEDLRDHLAADWLSDTFEFCVKSLKIEETDEEMYTVFTERVEKYYLPVNVLAKSKDAAIAKVKAMNAEDRFEGVWNELQPDVSTNYSAELSEQEERGEGSLA